MRHTDLPEGIRRGCMTQAIGKVGSKLLLDMHFVPGLQCLPVNCDTHHPMHTLSLAPGSQAVWVLLLFSCEALIYASKYTTFVYESKALYPWSPHYRFCVCVLLCAGEMDIYQANSEALVMMAGADVGLPQQATYNGIPVEEWPRVVLSPSFAPCLDAIKVRPPGSGWEGGGWGWGPGGRATGGKGNTDGVVKVVGSAVRCGLHPAWMQAR